MSDPKVFAILTACDDSGLARDAFSLPANVRCYRKVAGSIVQEPTIDSRATIPASQTSGESQTKSGDQIWLRLDNPLKDPKNGWCFGIDPSVCDVLLGHRGTRYISRHHFYITITERFRVELRDESTHGTVVGHDGQAKDVTLRKDKRLLFYAPSEPQHWKEIKIVAQPKADNGLAFKIEFPNHM